MTQLPKDPVGNHPFVDWLRAIVRCINERTIIDGPGIGISYEQKGTRIWVKPDTTTRRKPAGDLRWRGEWTSTATKPDGLGPYELNDIVIRGGAQTTNQGVNDLASGVICSTYIATGESPSGNPESSTSTGWSMFSRSFFPYLTVIDGRTATTTAELNALPRFSVNPIDTATGRRASCGIDLNALNGWPATFREVEVCVAGETKYMIVLATEPYDTQGMFNPASEP